MAPGASSRGDRCTSWGHGEDSQHGLQPLAILPTSAALIMLCPKAYQM